MDVGTTSLYYEIRRHELEKERGGGKKEASRKRVEEGIPTVCWDPFSKGQVEKI